jgi:hypothetical protein
MLSFRQIHIHRSSQYVLGEINSNQGRVRVHEGAEASLDSRVFSSMESPTTSYGQAFSAISQDLGTSRISYAWRQGELRKPHA